VRSGEPFRAFARKEKRKNPLASLAKIPEELPARARALEKERHSLGGVA
jgi:hypothetical protein